MLVLRRRSSHPSCRRCSPHSCTACIWDPFRGRPVAETTSSRRGGHLACTTSASNSLVVVMVMVVLLVLVGHQRRSHERYASRQHTRKVILWPLSSMVSPSFASGTPCVAALKCLSSRARHSHSIHATHQAFASEFHPLAFQQTHKIYTQLPSVPIKEPPEFRLHRRFDETKRYTYLFGHSGTQRTTTTVTSKVKTPT